MKTQNIDLKETKNKIENLKGQLVKLKINRGRNKIDNISAVINDVYPAVFTIITNGNIQTFSYFDILCGNVVIL